MMTILTSLLVAIAVLIAGIPILILGCLAEITNAINRIMQRSTLAGISLIFEGFKFLTKYTDTKISTDWLLFKSQKSDND